jgi:DNA-binding SARP family transcriptional activator
MTYSPKVLVVEDRADWQEIVCQALTSKGYIPHPAITYQEAVLALNTEQFDLAIIDPVLDTNNRLNRDGISVIQQIRNQQPHTAVMVITGSLTPDLRTSVQYLDPKAPILFKERWDPVEFGQLVDHLLGQESAPPAGVPAVVGPSGAPATVSPTRSSYGIRPRVLLVENRPDWQHIVGKLLDESDCFWRVASNAQQALQELEQESFHLVILDLKLQENELPLRSTEGWLLLDHLVEARPKTKIVVLSGRASAGDVANLLTQYPIITFVEKQSFNPEAIRQAITQVIQTPELRIQSLGQFRLWRDNQVIEFWERPQAETILKMLLIRRANGGRAVAADEIITRLWPESDEESGRKKLLPLISNARHTLEPEIEPRDSNFVLRSSNGYYFNLTEQVNWDLLDFREHHRLGRRYAQEKRWEEAVIVLEKGRTLYRGDFLAEDSYTDWVIDMRREVTTEFCDLLILLADAYAAQGRYPQAINAGETALRKDPLLESVYRRLMRYHYCNGEKGQAMRVYRDCLKLFEELFGESPTLTTRQLYQAITNDEVIDCQSTTLA